MKNKPRNTHGFHISERALSVATLTLLVALVALVVLSWLLSAMRLEGVRSLLSSEGIRWFFGSFTEMVGSPLLVWLLLVLASLGSLQKSGFPGCVTGGLSRLSYRERIALRVSCAFLIIYVGVICLLTLVPHAVLLSASGSLFPSAFSRSLVPIVTFGICLFSITFGMMSGRFASVLSALESLSFGIQKGAPLFIFYIMFIQFYESLMYVFG